MEQAQTDEECEEYEGSDEEETGSSINVHAPVLSPPAWKRVWLQFLFFGQFYSAPCLTLGPPAFCACGVLNCSRFHAATAEAARIKPMRRTACATGTLQFHLRPWISVSTEVTSQGNSYGA